MFFLFCFYKSITIRKKSTLFYNEIEHDIYIDFKGKPIYLVILWLGNHVHYMFIFTFFVQLFLKVSGFASFFFFLKKKKKKKKKTVIWYKVFVSNIDNFKYYYPSAISKTIDILVIV